IESDLFYFSGISLAILPPADRDRLLAIARRCQGQVAFDGNYRPYGWQSINVARRCLEAVGKIATIALPTAEDDNALFGPASAEDHGRRWRAYGVGVVAVKDGADGAWVIEGDETPGHVRVERRVQPVDTTGAGDSFNAGFLAAWLDGKPAFLASAAGNRLAGQVIQHRGALIPHDAMP
ncbi:MAG: PfkB family carbohydrate kinase, partial [Pseudomonadota bacterium]